MNFIQEPNCDYPITYQHLINGYPLTMTDFIGLINNTDGDEAMYFYMIYTTNIKYVGQSFTIEGNAFL